MSGSELFFEPKGVAKSLSDQWFVISPARIYLAKDGESLIVLFGGGTKRRQQSDIDRAKALHAEYEARKSPPPIDRNAKKRKR